MFLEKGFVEGWGDLGPGVGFGGVLGGVFFESEADALTYIIYCCVDHVTLNSNHGEPIHPLYKTFLSGEALRRVFSFFHLWSIS